MQLDLPPQPLRRTQGADGWRADLPLGRDAREMWRRRRRRSTPAPEHVAGTCFLAPTGFVLQRHAWWSSMGCWTPTSEIAQVNSEADDATLGRAVLETLRLPPAVALEGNSDLSAILAAAGVKSHRQLVRQARSVALQRDEGQVRVQPTDRPTTGGWAGQSNDWLMCDLDEARIGQIVRVGLECST